jgi:hypothetical protein
MAKIHKIYVPIFPVVIHYCSEGKPLEDKYNLYHEGAVYGGFSYHKEGTQDIILHLPHTDGKIDFYHLIHECMHVAMYIADITGLDPTTRQNESVAYLAQWVGEKICDIVAKDARQS